MAKKTAENKAKELPPLTPEAAAAEAAGMTEGPDPARFERQARGGSLEPGSTKKVAKERLFAWDHDRDTAVLAYAPGEAIREDDDRALFGQDELDKAAAKAGKPKAVVDEVKAGTDDATRQRATGDTYDRRALEQGLPTEEQQRLQQEGAD